MDLVCVYVFGDKVGIATRPVSISSELPSHLIKEKDTFISELSLIVSILFFIGGLISLYIVLYSINEEEIAIE